MAKKLVYNYTFDASAQTVKITGLYTLRTLILITNVTDQQIIYNFADSNAGGTVSYDATNDETTITLEYDTTTMSDSDELQILLDDGGDVKIDAGESLLDPVHKFRVSNPQNLIDTDFEYGLQPTKWETIELVDNIPSVYVRGSGVSIAGITDVTTIANSEIITVNTSIAHDLSAGDPIEVQGTSSRTANGKYIVTTVVTTTQFQYKASAVQASASDVKTAYTTIIPGSFFEGSELQYDEEGILTDDLTESCILITTDYEHGLSAGISLYLTNTVGEKLLTMSEQPLDTAPDGDRYINIGTNTIYYQNHGFKTGDSVIIAPDTVANPSARLPSTPSGVVEPRTSSLACDTAYTAAKTACETIAQTLKTNNIDLPFYMYGGSSSNTSRYAWYNYGTRTPLPYGWNQFLVFGEFMGQTNSYWDLSYQRDDSSTWGTYRWYPFYEGSNVLFTGNPFNLGAYYGRYSVPSVDYSSSPSTLSGHIWYQATPYVFNAYTDFLLTIKTFDSPEATVNKTGLRNYYDYPGNRSYPRRWQVDFPTQTTNYSNSRGVQTYERNTGTTVVHGNGWKYRWASNIMYAYQSQNNGYLCGGITLYIILYNTSDYTEPYDGFSSFNYYTRSNRYTFSIETRGGWGQSVHIEYYSNHRVTGAFGTKNQMETSSGTVISASQIADDLVTAVVDAHTYATFSNPTGDNSVFVVFYDDDRIGFKDSLDRIYDFTGIQNNVNTPITVRTQEPILGGADDYYDIDAVGVNTIGIRPGIRIRPRNLNFDSNDFVYDMDERWWFKFDNNVRHSAVDGQKATFNLLTGTAPAGLTNGGTYYIIVGDDKYITLADSKVNATSGVSVITGAGSGTFSIDIPSISGKVVGVGSVSATEFNSVITGTNTKFRSTFKVGDTISVVSTGSTINAFYDFIIDSIVSDTSLSISGPPGIGVTDVDYFVKTKVNVRADGTFIHRPFDGGVEITAGTSPDSTIVRQTRKYFRYQSGKGIQCSMAINFNPYRLVKTATASSNTVTITTEYPHGISSGDSIKVRGASSSPYNGTFTVTAATEFTFTYTALTTPAATAGGFIEYTINGYSNAGIRAGLFDFQNGFFFEYDGSDLYAVRRSSVQQLAGTAIVNKGSNIIIGEGTSFNDQLSVGNYIVIRGQSHKVTAVVSDTEIHIQPYYRGTSNRGVVLTKTVDTKVAQSNWNIDKADGSGPSGYILDITSIQMVYLDYSWYGAGKIRFGFKDTYGHVKYMHEFIHNNRLNEAYMRSGNIPARYEAFNTGTPTYVPGLFHWGTSVIMDGGFDDDDSYLFSASGNTLTFTNGSIETATTTGAGTLVSDGRRYYKNYYLRIPFADTDASKFTTGIQLYTSNGELTGEAVDYTDFGSGSTFYVYIYLSTGFQAPAVYPTITSGQTINIGGESAGTTDVDLTGLIPLISIRLAPSADNNIIGELGERDIINRMQLKLKELGITASHDTEITVLLNASLSNLQYQSVGTPSLSQYIVHEQGDTVDEGVTIYKFRASGGSVDLTGKRLSSSNAFDLSSLTDLGNSILGGDGVFPNGPDIITICATVINTSEIDSGNSYQIASRLSWAESQA